MYKLRICNDIEEYGIIWEKIYPKTCIFDLWFVRKCFSDMYNHKPYFLIIEKNQIIQGLIALAWIDEKKYYDNFPGEIWNGST